MSRFRKLSIPGPSGQTIMLMALQAILVASGTVTVWALALINLFAFSILLFSSLRTEKRLKAAEDFSRSVV